MPWRRSLLAVVVMCGVTRTADWPQWLGPNRDNSAADKVKPWKEAPKALWKQPVGEAHSSPVVADGRVFVHTRVKDKDAEEVSAFDAKTGKPLWSKVYDRPELHKEFIRIFGVGPRST